MISEKRMLSIIFAIPGFINPLSLHNMELICLSSGSLISPELVPDVMKFEPIRITKRNEFIYERLGKKKNQKLPLTN